MRRLLIAALLGTALLLTVPAVTSGASDSGPVGVDVSVTRHNDTAVRYEFDFEVPQRVDSFQVQLYDGAVVDQRGFRPPVTSRIARWNGSEDTTLTVIQRVGDGADRRCVCLASERWLAVQPIRATLRTGTSDQRYRTHLTDWFGGPTANASITATDGRFRSGVLYFGPTDASDRTLEDGQQLAVVAPDGQDQADADRVLDTLDDVAGRVDFTPGSDPSPTVVVVPHADSAVGDGGPNLLRARGLTISHGYAFVDGATGPGTWIHEYVHTQERYATSQEMRWYTEATAEYFGRRLADGLADRPIAETIASFEPVDGSDAVLGDRDTWESRQVPYHQGGRLIAYLDWRIRNVTDGEKGFVDVYRRLNDGDEIGLADLQRAVETVTGTPALTEEIDRLVTTDADPGAAWEPAEKAPTTTDQETTTTAPASASGDGESTTAPITTAVSERSSGSESDLLSRGSVILVFVALLTGLFRVR